MYCSRKHWSWKKQNHDHVEQQKHDHYGHPHSRPKSRYISHLDDNGAVAEVDDVDEEEESEEYSMFVYQNQKRKPHIMNQMVREL